MLERLIAKLPTQRKSIMTHDSSIESQVGWLGFFFNLSDKMNYKAIKAQLVSIIIKIAQVYLLRGRGCLQSMTPWTTLLYYLPSKQKTKKKKPLALFLVKVSWSKMKNIDDPPIVVVTSSQQQNSIGRLTFKHLRSNNGAGIRFHLQ